MWILPGCRIIPLEKNNRCALRSHYRLAGTTHKPNHSLAAALSARADYQSTVLSHGPKAYWRLNETAVPPVPVTTTPNLGSLGSAEDGTYTGAQGFFRGAPGAVAGNAGAFFDGSSQTLR